MTTTRSILLAGFAAFIVSAQAQPLQPKAQEPETRGELLYTTHCVTCHTTQMHWRANRMATDWGSLTAQVRRWQGNAGLQWSDADINEVARHLNNTIYRFPQPGDQLGLAATGARIR